MSSARIASILKSKLANSPLAQGIVGAFGLRLVYTGLSFVISILLARVLGTLGFGTYTYAVVWAYFLSVPATLGFDNFVVREIAVYQSQSNWPLMRGLLSWASKAVFVFSVTIALFAILVAWILDKGAYSEPFIGICLAMVLMPALSLRNVRRGAMRGLQNITKGLLPELLIDPLILITLTGTAYLIAPQHLSALWVIVFYGIGTVTTLFILNRFLIRSLPTAVKLAPTYSKGKAWLTGAFPFLLIESIPIINAQADVLMLGALKGVEAVGLYVPISRGAQLITFILMAVSSSLAPTIAKTYADKRLMDLQQTVTKSVRVVAGVAFLFAAALIVCGNAYLGLFGPGFVAGQRALYLLCVSTFIATSIGLARGILNMTGHERFTATLGWITTTLNIVLNLILIPRWGVEGAALATSISLLVGAFSSLIAVRQKLGIDATLMGLPAKTIKPK
ncbi:MAG: polysaccharide biosynthesis C-terminal domain-containing protein [Cyanobacteria bacterium J06634_5]